MELEDLRSSWALAPESVDYTLTWEPLTACGYLHVNVNQLKLNEIKKSFPQSTNHILSAQWPQRLEATVLICADIEHFHRYKMFYGKILA